jgi:hypothetical protein
MRQATKISKCHSALIGDGKTHVADAAHHMDSMTPHMLAQTTTSLSQLTAKGVTICF